MAYTYTNTPVVAKVKVGDDYYWLKDRDVRAILDTFNNTTVTSAVAAGVSDNNANLVTAAQVKSYVDTQIGAVNSFSIEVVSTLPTASANTMYKIYLIPSPNSVNQNVKDEYITLQNGSNYTWEQIGSTELDLSSYLTEDASVAGVEFGTNKAITADDLKTALDLGEFAYVNSGITEEIWTANSINSFNYTPEGSINVTLNQTSTAITSTGNFTPAGNVTGSVTAAGNVSAAKNNTSGAFQVSGSCSQPTTTVTLNSSSFLSSVKTAGTVPSFTEGAFTPASLTYAASDAFAKSGVTATVGTGTDAETLIFTAAATGTASVISAFSGGSKAADTFNAGAMPTFNSNNAATSVKSATTTAPNFTGDKFDLSFAGSETTIDAAFEGTQGNVSVSGNYDKASIGTKTFTGTEATVTPTLQGSSHQYMVYPNSTNT